MPLITALPLASLAGTLTTIVMVLFILSAFLLTVVILMQEGKGGGLSGAFGGAGTETFGVKAGAVNKFTAWLGGAFIVLALLHAGLVSASGVGTIAGDDTRETEQFESAEPAAGAAGNAEENSGEPAKNTEGEDKKPGEDGQPGKEDKPGGDDKPSDDEQDKEDK